VAIQTWGIPPNTWDVGTDGVKAHRVVRQDGTNYRKVVLAVPADENLIGVTTSARDANDSVGVRQIGEAWIECAEPIAIGDKVVVADDGGEVDDRGRVASEGVVGAGTVMVGWARSATSAPGQLCEVDLRPIGIAA
jgi:Uncharacterized conserved protein (DUF2190)